jgi:hypothetical protein
LLVIALEYANINGWKGCFPLIAFIYTLPRFYWEAPNRVFTQFNDMTKNGMSQQVIHPMVKLQRQVRSLVDGKLMKPTDSIWKIALLYGDDWSHWKQELLAFEFTMQDPVSDLLAVESWEEEE